MDLTNKSTCNIMSDLQWIAFDLDDTLHEFTFASRAAMEMVYDYLHEEFGLYHDDMRPAYSAILKEGQMNHFVDNIPSEVYRRQRFEKLFDRFSVLPHIHVDECLKIYDESLSEVLTLKEGALDVLQECKRQGLQIMIVSEGPYDAQEKTLQRLGISEYIDRIYTSSRMGVHKTNGLLQKALEDAGCRVDECVMLGDNLERDIKPALAIGVTAIWVSNSPQSFSVPHVQSLMQIANRLKTKSMQQEFPVPKVMG